MAETGSCFWKPALWVQLCFAAAKLWRFGRTVQGWSYGLIFSWLLAPVILVAAVSVVKPMFLARYLSPCLPALMLLVAAGLTRLRPVMVAWGLAVVIFVLSLMGYSLLLQSRTSISTGMIGAAPIAYVLDHARPGRWGLFLRGFLGGCRLIFIEVCEGLPPFGRRRWFR